MTETVFAPLPPEMRQTQLPIPFNVLKQQTVAEKSLKLPVGEIGRCPPKVKRPLETNRLETGPPGKVTCFEMQTGPQETLPSISSWTPVSTSASNGKSKNQARTRGVCVCVCVGGGCMAPFSSTKKGEKKKRKKRKQGQKKTKAI